MADTDERKDAAAGQGEGEGDGAAPAQRLPRRYRLYDKIKDHVSLRTVDTVIVVTALAIVALLVIGIATAGKG